MKTSAILLFIVNFFLLVTCNGQPIKNQEKSYMDNFELSPESAHPKAKELLTKEFYWSPIDESAPFGSDDGSDAFYWFRQWRQSNPNQSPVRFLDELINGWGFPKFDIYQLETSYIKSYLTSNDKGDTSLISAQIPEMKKQFEQMAKSAGKEFDEAQFYQILEQSTKGMGYTYLRGFDNAIIAVGFGQFVIEGKIDDDIKNLAKIALTREKLPFLLERWGEYQDVRKEMLVQMLADLNKI